MSIVHRVNFTNYEYHNINQNHIPIYMILHSIQSSMLLMLIIYDDYE
jgi:hypothetical protein